MMISSDVVDMDACHVLLGRLWQFDREVVYKGRENTYVFLWKGRKIALLPLTITDQSSQPTPVDKKGILLTASPFDFKIATKESSCFNG